MGMKARAQRRTGVEEVDAEQYRLAMDRQDIDRLLEELGVTWWRGQGAVQELVDILVKWKMDSDQ